jgi:hypothetical protein
LKYRKGQGTVLERKKLEHAKRAAQERERVLSEALGIKIELKEEHQIFKSTLKD